MQRFREVNSKFALVQKDEEASEMVWIRLPGSPLIVSDMSTYW
jgi:hypothetical protein